MKIANWITCGGFVLAMPALAAGPLTGACTADFAVKATMDSFVGHVTSDPVSVDLEANEVLTVKVGVTHMATGKAKRDKEMFHMFSAPDFPLIVGTVDAAALKALAASATRTELPITLTIHGVTKPVVAQVAKWNRTDDALSFDAAFTVPLRDFNLKPPSVMKLIRVNNEVHVIAHVVLNR